MEMNSVWLTVVPFVLVYAAIRVGIPVLILLAILRHHRRKMAELWLQTVRQGAIPPPEPLFRVPRVPRAAFVKAWSVLRYPKT